MIARINAHFAEPGTVAWLMKHELLITYRSFGGKSIKVFLIWFGILWAAVHAVAFLTLFSLSKASEAGMAIPPTIIPWVGLTFWVMFSIMISQTLAQSVNAFFTRGDLDLLLSSPIDPRVVLTIRALAIGFSASLLVILLALPFAHAGVLVGRPSLLSIYPTMIAVSMLAGAIGVWLTMSLVALVGARRARVFAQVGGALIGAGFFLASQAQNLLPRDMRVAFAQWVRAHAQDGGIFAPDSWLWWPARAMMGEWLPMLALLALTLAVFAIVMQLMVKRFVEGSQESQSVARKSTVQREAASVRFGTGKVWFMLVKEWRLIVRDPQVISQTLLQIMYLVPTVVLAFSSKSAGILAVPALVILAAMLTSNLAWLTIAAEDAPELIGASPVGVQRARFMKAAAAVIPVLTIISPLAIYWLITKPLHGITLIFCVTAAAASSAACQMLNPAKGDRKEMNKRGKQNPMAGFLDVATAFAWAGVAAGILGPWWAILVSAPFTAAGPLYAWIMGAETRAAGEWA